MINQIIDYNRSFVERKGYEPFITDKYPDKKLAVLTSGGTRIEERRCEDYQERRRTDSLAI